MSNEEEIATNDISLEIMKYAPNLKDEIIEKFVLAILGCIPWVGGVISAAVSIKTEEGSRKYNELQLKWLQEHEKKIAELQDMMQYVLQRFNELGDGITERISNEEYLSLARKIARIWDQAETSEKKKYAANILINSAATNLCTDNIIRLFIDWLNIYHELHFTVIGQIYHNEEITRYRIWRNISGEPPAEDSAEADLFKLIIRDLSTGGVIRQKKDTNIQGQFLRERRGRNSNSNTLESAFDNTKGYVLTKLGSQFVHYTMNENILRLTDNT